MRLYFPRAFDFIGCQTFLWSEGWEGWGSNVQHTLKQVSRWAATAHDQLETPCWEKITTILTWNHAELVLTTHLSMSHEYCAIVAWTPGNWNKKGSRGVQDTSDDSVTILREKWSRNMFKIHATEARIPATHARKQTPNSRERFDTFWKLSHKCRSQLVASSRSPVR